MDLDKLENLAKKIDEHFAQSKNDNNIEWIKDDLAFHEYIVRQSGNSYAYKAWTSIKNQVLTILRTAYGKIPDILQPVGDYGDHNRIVQYIREENLEKATNKIKHSILDAAKQICSAM